MARQSKNKKRLEESLEETRKRMRESQKRLEIELREMRRRAPHTHKDDHRVVINI